VNRHRRGAYGLLIRHVMAPTMDALRGTHTMRALRELEDSQWWPLSRLEELQATKLNALISHAYQNVPYYRRLMERANLRPCAIRSVADLPRFPVLTRDIVRTSLTEMRATDYPAHKLRRGTTGGSTGQPLVFYSTLDDQRTRGFARGIRALQYAGVDLGERRLLIRIQRHRTSSRERALHRLSRILENVHELDSRDITESTLPGIVSYLDRDDVRCLTGYPSAVSFIASWIEENDTTVPALDAIVTGGEQLFAHQRQRIRNVLGLEPFSKYSTNEVFEIAMECETHSGMHVAAEDLIVEIVDEEGKPVPPGTEGRVLITNLHNYGMPFIRYDLEDTGAFLAGPCPCGRELPRLSHVLGRRFDMIHTPSGRHVSGANLGTNRLANMPVRKFQFVQEALDHLVIRLVALPGTPDSDLSAMRSRIPPMLNEILGDDVRVEVRFQDDIELTSGGKHLLVISKVDPESWLNKGPTADSR